MAEESSKRTPPYIPFATFENFINGLSESGVPHKIDSSLLRNLSGSARSGLMVALRFFSLIDENDITGAELEELANASGDVRKATLRKMVSAAYGFLAKHSFDLKRATPAQLLEAIGDEGATGGTRDKAFAFFIKAAEAAGIEVSPFILKRKHSSAGGTRRQKRAPKSRVEKSHNTGNQNSDKQTKTERSVYDVLMKEIYDPKMMKADSAEERAVFVLARYLATKQTGN